MFASLTAPRIPMLIVVGILATAGRASAVKSAPPSTQPAPVEADGPPAATLRAGPKYLLLRYDEDYGYLDGPEDSREHDVFDPIKRIHVAPDWTLSLGGEARVRMESETNRNFGQRDPTQDTFLLYREILHLDLHYRDLARIYVEGIDARVADRDLPQQPGMQNTFDVNQLFIDATILGKGTPLTLRVGRQEMSYGKDRIIGKGDWTDSTRRFDGVKVMYRSSRFDVDVFWTKPVQFMNKPFSNSWNTHINEGMHRKPDHWREEQNFYGMYSTFKGIPNHVVDLYFLGLNDRGIFVNANNRFGDLNVYTLGSRFAGKTGDFDYDLEGGGQWGKWDGDEVHAWMFASDGGYTFKNVSMTPRVGAGFDYASGDDTPRDRSHDTWNQLYPTGHAHLGYIDLVGRQNILAPNLNLSFKPIKSVTARLAWYHFWLNSNLDALYNAGGSPLRRNSTGSSGNDVGDELDATVNWQMDVHSAILVGWAHFWPSNFIDSSGYSRDADYLFLQYQFKF